MTNIPSASSTALTPTSTHIRTLLRRLHDESSAQEAAIPASAMAAIRSRYTSDLAGASAAMDELMRNKFIALDEDKAHFMYNLLRATGARNVVEIGTSFGVSTIYLALAVAENAQQQGKGGVVIATEKEASKAAVARAYWRDAGPEVERLIDLKEGDLTQILAERANLPDEPVDFVLMDIWPYVARPALELLMPHLRPGAVILTDNVISSREGYADYLSVLHAEDGVFNNAVLPYKGGFEMSVYRP